MSEYDYLVSDLVYRPLDNGERIRNGDFFEFKGGWFKATDTAVGIMDDNHYPHYRFVEECCDVE